MNKDQFDEQAERMTQANLSLIESNISLSREIANLRAARPHGLMLTADLAKLLTDKDNEIERLRADNERLKAQIAILHASRMDWIAEVDQLKARLAAWEELHGVKP